MRPNERPNKHPIRTAKISTARKCARTAGLLPGLLALACSSATPSVAPSKFTPAAPPETGHSAPLTPASPAQSSASATPESAAASDVEIAERELQTTTGTSSAASVAPSAPIAAPAHRGQLFLEFHPQFVLAIPDFGQARPPANPEPIAAPDSDADGNADANAGIAPNPPVVTIDGEPLLADRFAERGFRMHHDWYMLWLKELLVEHVAKLEAVREGITFSDAEIDAAHTAVMEFIKQRARRMQQSFRGLWQSQGYATEAAYTAAWRAQVKRLLLLERLFFLLDLRLAKVEYSWIVIPDVADRFTPDPARKAARLAEQLRKGEISWNRAVQTHTADAQTRSSNGKRGVIVRGALGVPELENWLFSHAAGDISDPLRHPVHGFIIARVDRVEAGNERLTYAEAKPEIERRLAQQQGIPGTRVTPRDTFIWLERMAGTGRYEIRSFAPVAVDGVPRICEVNAVPITVGEFVVHAFESKPDWARQVLSEVIVFHVADLEAAREGLSIADDAVTAGTETILKFLRESSTKRGEDFDHVWQSQGYESLDAFCDAVLRPLVRENLQLERLVFLHDRRVERRDVWHILTQDESYAKQAHALIVTEGKKFEDVAKAFSQHAATRQTGGRVGIVPRDLYSESFSGPVFGLSVNEISAPFQTDQGWHVARVTQIFPARPNLPWADAKTEIEAALAERAGIPGQRIAAADTYRWISAIKNADRHRIVVHFPPEE